MLAVRRFGLDSAPAVHSGGGYDQWDLAHVCKAGNKKNK